MRVLVEALAIRTGGGVQTALDVLDHLARDSSVRAAVICSREVSCQLGGDTASLFANFVEAEVSTYLQVAKARLRAHQLEYSFQPDVVYTIFGPSYWLPKAPQVTGFAMPFLLNPRVAKRLYPGGIDSYIDYSSWKNIARRISLNNSRGYLVESEVVKGKLARYLRVPEKNIMVMGNTFGQGFDLHHFRNRYLTSSNILVPAAYYPHKNLEIIPFVAAAMVKQRPTRDFRFTLTIPGDSAPWARIAKAARAVNVSDHVCTVGGRPCAEMPMVYETADCIFLPTLLECSTRAYPEAFKAERPVVTSRRDFAESDCGDAVAYCDPLDPEDCARQIASVLDNENWARTLVSRGMSRLSTHYVTASERYSRIRTALDCFATR
jgi:glycosyltransferase involved in cell wall biosynthesis